MQRPAQNAEEKKLVAEIHSLNRTTLIIIPFVSYYRIDAEKGSEAQKELIGQLNRCGLRTGIDFSYGQPRSLSLEMISYENTKQLLVQYYVSFDSPGKVLNALKVLPAHIVLRHPNNVTAPINIEECRTLFALQHSDNELIMPDDLEMICELHKRSYRELRGKVTAIIQTNSASTYSSLVNFQSAFKYIDENLKDNPYRVEESQYSMLVLALWYVVQELKAEIRPEEKKGFFDNLIKKKGNHSPQLDPSDQIAVMQ